MMKNLKQGITNQNKFVSCITIKHFLHIKSYVEKRQRLFNEKHSMNLYVYFFFFFPIGILQLDIESVKDKKKTK